MTTLPVINQSQVKAWRHCEMRWDFQYRQRLEKKRRDRPLHLGSWVHAALESHYRDGDWRVGHMVYLQDYNKLFEEERRALDRGRLKTANPEPLPKQVERIMRSYIWYNRNDHWQVVGVEQEFELDIPATPASAFTQGDKIGDLPAFTFKGRIDLIVRDADGLLWIVDHKTTDQIPDKGAFHAMEPQLILYPWAAEQALNIKTEGVIFNYLRSQAPSVPKLNKDGTNSKAAISTDYPTAVTFLRDNGLKASDYTDWLFTLKGESDFLARYYLPRTKEVTEQVVAETLFTAREIIEHRTVTRNVTRDCSWCPYMQLCRAELFGLDATFLRGRDYRVVEDPNSTGREDSDGNSSIS